MSCCLNKGKAITLILFSIIQVLSIFYYANYFVDNGYLPGPFVHDKSDSFMDLFHTMWWADNDGRYSEWGSVYPPLNFILLSIIKWIFLDGINFSDAFALRNAGYSIKVFFICLYLITPIIVLKTSLWKNFSLTEKILIYVGVILSAPMLFALERGNIVIFTLIFLALALSNSGMSRSVSMAILINIKPYFALLLIHYVIMRRWNDLLICILMSGGLYLMAGLILDVNFMLFLVNILKFSQNEAIFSLREVMSMPSSISAFSYVLVSDALKFSPDYSAVVEATLLAGIMGTAKWLIITSILLALIYAHKHFSDNQVIAILVVAITNLGVWIGGYSLIFYVALIPVFYGMEFRRIYYGILFLLFIPLDVIPVIQTNVGEQYSYLSDSLVQVSWTLNMGSIARPILNFLLLIVLFYEVFSKIKKHPESIQSPSAQASIKLGVN